jgi:putative oxidoreductase
MLFAIGLVHMDELFALSEHGGWAIELQAMFLLGGLAVMFLGSGRFALKPD